jgi:hypothetical protein
MLHYAPRLAHNALAIPPPAPGACSPCTFLHVHVCAHVTTRTRAQVFPPREKSRAVTTRAQRCYTQGVEPGRLEPVKASHLRGGDTLVTLHDPPGEVRQNTPMGKAASVGMEVSVLTI